MNATAKTTATGRRKSAVARVYLRPSVGGEDQMIVVNGESGDDYFNREILMLLVKQPLEATETVGQFDFICNVKGGGKAGGKGG